MYWLFIYASKYFSYTTIVSDLTETIDNSQKWMLFRQGAHASGHSFVIYIIEVVYIKF